MKRLAASGFFECLLIPSCQPPSVEADSIGFHSQGDWVCYPHLDGYEDFLRRDDWSRLVAYLLLGGWLDDFQVDDLEH